MDSTAWNWMREGLLVVFQLSAPIFGGLVVAALVLMGIDAALRVRDPSVDIVVKLLAVGGALLATFDWWWPDTLALARATMAAIGGVGL